MTDEEVIDEEMFENASKIISEHRRIMKNIVDFYKNFYKNKKAGEKKC